MDVGIFEFEIIAKDGLKLPPYKGSAFRGLFGHALRKTVCVTNMINCGGCLLRDNCAYSYIFETTNGRDEKVAHPFIIEPPQTQNSLFPEGDSLKVKLVLIGKAIEYLPYLIYTFREMGKIGIGASRGKFWLKKVKELISPEHVTIYDHVQQSINTGFQRLNLHEIQPIETDHLRLHFITTTAIKVDGRVAKEIDFVQLLKAIQRRLKSLNFYHSNGNNGVDGFDMDAAKKIEIVASKIEDMEWQRYSNRQKTKISLDGFSGTMELRGNLTPCFPLLKKGELLHVGRGTVYGMGKYLIEKIA